MIQPRTNAFFVRLRRLILGALVLGLLVIAGLLYFGRAGQDSQTPSGEAPAPNAGRKLTLVGEDFDYTFSEGEHPLFRIRGRSVAVDKAETVYLEGVALTVFDKEGHEYHISSRKANFNRPTNEGQLTGDVLLKGPGDLELRSARIDLRNNSNVVVSPDAVEIRYAKKFVVRAGRLKASLPDQEFILDDACRADSLPGVQPPLSLVANRLVYERRQRWLRVEGGADLRRGIDRLEANRMSAFLSEDESALQFVRALGAVSGVTHATERPGQQARPQPTTVRFAGKVLSALLLPTGNQVKRVELESDAEGRVELTSTNQGGLVRTLTAKRLDGVLNEGVLSSADAFGGVEIHEIVPAAARGGQPAQRQANGQRGQASFTAEGQLATLTLDSEVVFRDAATTATGNRATLELDKGRGEFFGSPVVVTNERGSIKAPRLVYSTDQKIVNARGGVKTEMVKTSDTALDQSPLAAGDGPVHVESQEAFWRNAPPSFLFRGDVRAWQGENLLLAPELRGDRDVDQLLATGGVKTLWVQKDEESRAAKPAGRPAHRDPIQVTGRDLEYRKTAGLIVYTGNVRVDQNGKTLSCQRLEVTLAKDDHTAESMTCTGDVKVTDPKAGRLIEGQKAVYQVTQRRIDVSGEPVVMTDREGNKVRGRIVAYFVDDGKVEVKGKEGSP